jgi:phage tail sheath gpL-like
MAHWGVVASYGTGTLTFTAKQKGLRGNQLRVKMFISSGITTALSALTTETAFSGGTTADSNATALATLSTARYYYNVSAAGDATQLGAVATQANTLSAPTTGMRCRCIGASVDTLANATTIATGINKARTEIVWQEKSAWPEAELAANHAAIITAFEVAPKPRTNFCGFGNDAITSQYWRVPAQRLKTAWPSRTSIKSALNNGLTPIGVTARGATYLVNRITTRSLNGSVNDYRIRPAHKVSICDFFGDDLLATINAQFSGKSIANDPVQGQRAPGPTVVTPIILKGAIFTRLDQYDSNDLLQNVSVIKANTIVQREASPTTRLSARIPLQPVDNAEQFALAVDQVA